MAAAQVFDSVDLMEVIMSKVAHSPFVAGLRYVNRTCDVVGRRLYQEMEKEPAEQLARVLSVFDFQKFITHRASDRRKSIMLVEYIHGLYLADWTYFVRDITYMERMFYLASTYHRDRPCGIFEDRYEAIYDKIRPYLYIENHQEYTVAELRKLAQFKGKIGTYKMNRGQLARYLRRPKDEVYCPHHTGSWFTIRGAYKGLG